MMNEGTTTNLKPGRQVLKQSHQNKPLDLRDIIVFDGNCDDLEQLSSQVSSNTYNSEKYAYHKKGSCLSDQTEKRKNEVRQKFKGYLERQGRHSIDQTHRSRKKDENQQQSEQQDGRLINELDSIQFVEKFNRQNQQFILLFNKNPQNAINEYVKRGIIPNENPEAVAEYLIKTEGLNKNTLGEFFGQNNGDVLKIMHQYCKMLDFKGKQFDKALRSMLTKFRLPGEAQQIQRVIYEFTLAYFQLNPGAISNVDQLFPLAYSIIMLATDAHNPKQEKKMTEEEFIKNTRGACPSIQPEYLSGIYGRITKQKFETETTYIETLYARLRDLSLPNLTEALKFTKDLMKGDVFLKSCYNTNKFVQRKLYLSDDQTKIMWISDPPKGIINEDPRYILIADIIDLTLGIGSEVMRKNKVPKQFDSMCFTITTYYRTLDLKAKSNKDRAKWVNYIRAVLIQRRQQKRAKLEHQYGAKWNAEKIQQIWNTDIFPKWDTHWDYKLKKPKQKGYIARGLEAICCCWNTSNTDQDFHSSGFKIKSTLLQSLWKYGLPPNSRKTLWCLIIGDGLKYTPHILEELRKRRREVKQLERCPFDKQVIQMVQTLLVIRPDLPPVRDLLLMGEVFYRVMPRGQQLALKGSKASDPLDSLANLIHTHHFLAFYRGDKTEIDLRIQLFEHLLDKNAASVKSHFKGLKLETRMYLVSWFLSVFSNCFIGEFLYRVWDNFLLEGEVYLFKVGIAIIKYYEIELKMCTFHEGLKLLRFPKNTSPVLFFEILQNEIDVKVEDYQDYVEKRKHAIIKTKVQSIPLE